MSREKKTLITAAIVFIIVLNVVVFSPALKGGFLHCWDDYLYVVNNTDIQKLSLSNIHNIFTKFILGNYHPLTVFSFAIEYHFFGLNSQAYHMTNLIIHILNCLLVFWFALLLTRNVYVSSILSVLFAIHPIHVESVAWISDRKDLLSAFFFLLTLISYLYYTDKKQLKFYILSLLLYFLSLLSKASAVSLPFVLLLIEYLNKKKFEKNSLIKKVPFFAVAGIWGVIAIFARRSYQSQLQESFFSFYQKLSIAVHRLVSYYLFRFFSVAKLSYLKPYLFENSAEAILFLVIASVLLLIAIFLIFLSAKRTKKVVFGFLFFFVTIFPALPVVTLGYSADRFLYISSIGIFYMFAEGFIWLYQTNKRALRTVFLIVFALLVFLFSHTSYNRCKVWKNCLALTNYFISQYPSDPTVYLNRGLSYKDMGKYKEAIEDFSHAIDINPDYLDAYIQRGDVYLYLKQYSNAISDFSRAIEIDPHNAEGFYKRGNAYYDIGDFKKAVEDFKSSITIDSTHAEVYYNRGNCYARLGDHKNAVADFSHSLKVDPTNVKARYNRGVAFIILGEYSNAIEDFNIILKKSYNPNVLYSWAVAYLLNNEPEKAKSDVEELEKMRYKVPSDFLKKLKGIR